MRDHGIPVQAVPGEHGGVILRRFSGAGRTWQGGERVPAYVTKTWRPSNRTVLAGTYVEFYRTPQPDEKRFEKQWREFEDGAPEADPDGGGDHVTP
jgi:hypothetical protein